MNLVKNACCPFWQLPSDGMGCNRKAKKHHASLIPPNGASNNFGRGYYFSFELVSSYRQSPVRLFSEGFRRYVFYGSHAVRLHMLHTPQVMRFKFLNVPISRNLRGTKII